jgi:hypothetical protein
MINFESKNIVNAYSLIEFKCFILRKADAI